MNLTELKKTPVSDLISLAESVGAESTRSSRRQDIIFSILKTKSRNREDITSEGVLEILENGFGFLRSADESYQPGPDDIYVSPNQIKRFDLRTGDTIAGKIRPPRDGERYFALLKIDTVNYQSLEQARDKVLFENLTPLHAEERLRLECGSGSSEGYYCSDYRFDFPCWKRATGIAGFSA